jgi:hypothetical protein
MRIFRKIVFIFFKIIYFFCKKKLIIYILNRKNVKKKLIIYILNRKNVIYIKLFLKLRRLLIKYNTLTIEKTFFINENKVLYTVQIQMVFSKRKIE